MYSHTITLSRNTDYIRIQYRGSARAALFSGVQLRLFPNLFFSLSPFFRYRLAPLLARASASEKNRRRKFEEREARVLEKRLRIFLRSDEPQPEAQNITVIAIVHPVASIYITVYLLMILRLHEVNLLLDPVAGVADRKFERLGRL